MSSFAAPGDWREKLERAYGSHETSSSSRGVGFKDLSRNKFRISNVESFGMSIAGSGGQMIHVY